MAKRPSHPQGPDAIARRMARLERENRRLVAEIRSLRAAGKLAAKSGKAEGRAARKAGKTASKHGAEAIRDAARAAKKAGRAARRGAPGAPPPPPPPPSSGGPLLPGWRRLPGASRRYAGPGGAVLSRRQYDKMIAQTGVPRRPMPEAQRIAATQGTRDFALFARAYQTRQQKLGVKLQLRDVRALPSIRELNKASAPVIAEIRALPPSDPERRALIRDLADLWRDYDLDWDAFREMMEELSP